MNTLILARIAARRADLDTLHAHLHRALPDTPDHRRRQRAAELLAEAGHVALALPLFADAHAALLREDDRGAACGVARTAVDLVPADVHWRLRLARDYLALDLHSLAEECLAEGAWLARDDETRDLFDRLRARSAPLAAAA